ncbi:hypothetical protein [Motiliproteus sp.]|uniref:hypothetical protein n=1 Tax=Motiliproteus sp. TaxID=1898955 RepID=UPI003BA933AD
MEVNQSHSAIKCGAKFIEEYDGPSAHTQPYDVLKRIFAHGSRQDGSNDEAVVFTWQDLADDADALDEGKRLKRNIKKAIVRLDEHQDKLNEIATEYNLKYRPVIVQLETGGGSGNLSRYKVQPVIADTKSVVKASEVPEGYIRYSLENIKKHNRLARLINGFDATGLKFHALTGTVLVAIILGTIISIAGLFSLTAQTSVFGLLSTLLNTSLALGALFVAFSPLYLCITNRIIVAPTILVPSNLHTLQLEYSPTDKKRADGSTVREFRIVSYVSKCSICGDRVEVENGLGAMRGRLVGRCNASPREHVFTFDHITRLGAPIFSEYQEICATSLRN